MLLWKTRFFGRLQAAPPQQPVRVRQPRARSMDRNGNNKTEAKADSRRVGAGSVLIAGRRFRPNRAGRFDWRRGKPS